MWFIIPKTNQNINLNLFLSLNQNKMNNLREINTYPSQTSPTQTPVPIFGPMVLNRVRQRAPKGRAWEQVPFRHAATHIIFVYELSPKNKSN